MTRRPDDSIVRGILRRNRRVGRLAALFACLALLASSLCAQTPQKSRIVTVDHGAKDPAISPDGARIAISVLGKIFVLLRAGGEAQQVSSGISWDTNPAWSPDGQFLAFAQDM